MAPRRPIEKSERTRSPRALRFAILATDVVLFTVDGDTLKVLLGPVTSPFFAGQRGVPGGLLHPGETAEEAAGRLLWERGGMRDVYMEQLATFSRVDRDPRGRVVAVAHLALVPPTRMTPAPRAGVEWWPVKKLPALAYDHDEIVGAAVERLRSKLAYTNIAFALMPDQLTLTELQTVYEAVLERPLDKRNFRKKILALRLLVPLARTRGGAYRPARLYRFRDRALRVVDVV